MSCIVSAILKRYPDGDLPAEESGRTMTSAYKGSTGTSISIKGWIRGQRTNEEFADFYSFDEAEEGFSQAIKSGETLNQGQVRDTSST